MSLAAVRLRGLLQISVLVGTINGLSRVALPLYTAQVGGQPWQVGMAGGLGYAGILLLALPLAPLMERHGGRKLFGWGVLAAALVYLAGLPLAELPWQVLVLTGLLGLLLPLRTLPPQTDFLHLMPQLPPRQAGWSRAATTLGMFLLGPMAAAFLIGCLGYAGTFRVVGVLLVLSWWIGRRALSGAEAIPASGTIGRSLLSRVLRGIRQQLVLLVEQPALRRAMAYDFVTQMAVAYFVVFIVVLAVQQFHQPVSTGAALVTLQGGVFVAVLFAGGHLLEGRMEAQLYRWAFAGLLGFALLAGFASSVTLLWASAALLGAGLAIQSLTAVMRFSALMQRHGRGRVAGLISLAPPAGGVVGTVLGGVLSQHAGPQAGFLVLAVASAAVLVLQGLHPEDRQDHRTD